MQTRTFVHASCADALLFIPLNLKIMKGITMETENKRTTAQVLVDSLKP